MAADKTKTERVIYLLILLLEGGAYGLQELGRKLSISERSVFRDIEELNRIGFDIKNEHGRYRMKPDNKLARSFQKALAGGAQPLAVAGQTKDSGEREKAAKHTLLISSAISQKKAIRLLDYQSGKGISFPRTLEPFRLNPEDQTLWAFDTSNNDCRQFKILRIGTVEVLDTPWQHAHRHQLPFTDIFNLSAAAPLDTIKLKLGTTALNLIREEYPGSRQFQSRQNSAVFNIPVADYRGAGRFVLGLMDSIEVVGSPEFKKYLRNLVTKFAKY